MISSLLLCVALLPQSPPIEWMVRDVIPPVSFSNDHRFIWGQTWPFGAGSQEGITGWIVSGQLEPQMYSGLEQRFLLDIYSGIGEATMEIVYPNSEFTTSSGTWATLATPYGYQVLIERNAGYSQPYGLVAINPESGQVVGTGTLPTGLPNGAPSPPAFGSLYPAGDINGDGYEDCFWHSNLSSPLYSYYGLLDGATLTSAWTRVDAGFEGIVPSFWEPRVLPDVTGDGHADFFVGNWGFSNGPEEYRHVWLLLSGVDGAVVWSQSGSNSNAIQFPYGRDLSGDGISDAVVWEGWPGDTLRGISVINGAELWQSSMVSLYGLAGQNQVIQMSGTELAFSHSLRTTGNDQVVVPCYLIDSPSQGSSTHTLGFGHYDAINGTFEGVDFVVGSLDPWSPDTFTASSPALIGDYDRDGLTEWYVRNFDPVNTPAQFAAMGQFSERMVILGQRTLFVPETHPFGSSVFQMDIAIPSAPNKDYLVLFSTAFDASGGLEMEKWETKLGVSSVLNYTFQQRQYAGTLDADGQGTTYISVPPYPPLQGSTLYSRAIILNSPGSAESIWTISSLGVTKIQ